ncbi:BMP family ABC transporter substrate-binding protein [Dictyobacter vulcani]|uniref:BMP family ABC transporter substrate-binding protein n=1 Tax=Dictyobacter vulcani TaxID=2607529 RepID=A0A5J4KNT8_9CHLR|nr:BMP family ABC transporter substrate-binding protein [Dictyobacter vulcani]GER91024.1 BMP family ABC transporter substrate-binding protein [Dictyobacter vulcani]
MRKSGAPSLLISLFVLCGVLLSACGGSTPSTNTNGGGSTTAPKSVTLVTDIGGLNDQSFNQSANVGYMKAQGELKFRRQVIESKSQNDYVSNLTRAAQTSDMVIGVGFLMATAMDQVAKANPTKSFALIDSCATDAKGNCDSLKNVAPLFFKEQQAGCLAGVVAGQMEKLGKAKSSKLLGNNTIAAIGGLAIPPVDHYIAGYQYCAKKVDPAVTVKVNYSQSFDNTAKCQDIANNQISTAKADVIFQVAGGCGVGALQAAKAKGVYSIGVDSDQSHVNDSVIASAIKRVDQAVYLTVKDFEAGKFSATPAPFDLTNDGVGLAGLSATVPAEVKPVVDKYIADIKSGAITVPDAVQK